MPSLQYGLTNYFHKKGPVSFMNTRHLIGKLVTVIPIYIITDIFQPKLKK